MFLATATASETTALVVSDGRTTVTIASAAYTSVADQVTAIQNGANYDNLLFTVDEAPGNKFEMTYKSVGALFATYLVTATAAETTTLVVSDGTTTVTIASATYTSVADQVTAIQGGTGYADLLFAISKATTGAVYLATATAAATTALVVSDGTTTVTIASAAYTSVASQVAAIQNGANYVNLLFTVTEATGNKFKITYKSPPALSTKPPSITGTGVGTVTEASGAFVLTYKTACSGTCSGITAPTITATVPPGSTHTVTEYIAGSPSITGASAHAVTAEIPGEDPWLLGPSIFHVTPNPVRPNTNVQSIPTI